MPSLDQIRQTAEKISGNPDNGTIRSFIDELMETLQTAETADSIPVTEQREQQRLH
jgi:hypothetical protein